MTTSTKPCKTPTGRRCWRCSISANCHALPENCAPLRAELRGLLTANNLDGAAALFPAIEQACPLRVKLEDAKLFSRLLAKQAKILVDQHKLSEAETLLDKANALPWPVHGVRGDIAAKRQQWEEAAQQYHLAYDILNDPQQFDPAQDRAETKRWMYQLASEAQLIAEKVDVISGRDGEDSLLLGARDIAVEESIPVQFDTDSAKLTANGRDSVEKLAAALSRQTALRHITVIGHTDERGDEAYNLRLSTQRAETVAQYLKQYHISVPIHTVGKGESAPKALYDPSRYTQEQIWAIQRRVELETSPR
ncbi:MAG: OmpA family protein [Candidatus Methylumidiphilus sp.]